MIVGVLSWYEEQPSMLATAVHGLAKVVDHIVAVDGAYAMFPNARTRSHPEQAEAIIRAAETEDVPVTVHRPNQLFFGNEIEKRNLTLQLCRPFCTTGRDWVLVWDADYHLMMCNPTLLRHQLDTTDCLAATYTLFDGVDLATNPHSAEFARNSDIDWQWTIRTRGIYRWTDDLEYTSAHFVMRGTYDGQVRYVYGPDLVGARNDDAVLRIQVPAEHLGRNLVVYHRQLERPLKRREFAADYYRRRDLAGAESIDFGEGPVDPDTGRPLADVAA